MLLGRRSWGNVSLTAGVGMADAYVKATTKTFTYIDASSLVPAGTVRLGWGFAEVSYTRTAKARYAEPHGQSASMEHSSVTFALRAKVGGK